MGGGVSACCFGEDDSAAVVSPTFRAVRHITESPGSCRGARGLSHDESSLRQTRFGAKDFPEHCPRPIQHEAHLPFSDPSCDEPPGGFPPGGRRKSETGVPLWGPGALDKAPMIPLGHQAAGCCASHPSETWLLPPHQRRHSAMVCPTGDMSPAQTPPQSMVSEEAQLLCCKEPPGFFPCGYPMATSPNCCGGKQARTEPIHARSPPKVMGSPEAAPESPDGSSPAPPPRLIVPPFDRRRASCFVQSPVRRSSDGGQTPPLALSARKRHTQAMLEKVLSRGPSILSLGQPKVNVKAMYGVEDTFEEDDHDGLSGIEPRSATTAPGPFESEVSSRDCEDGEDADDEEDSSSELAAHRGSYESSTIAPISTLLMPHTTSGLPPLPVRCGSAAGVEDPKHARHTHRGIRDHIRHHHKRGGSQHASELQAPNSSGQGLRDRLRRNRGEETRMRNSTIPIPARFAKDASPATQQALRQAALTHDHEAQRQFFKKQRTGFMMDPDNKDEVKKKQGLEFQKGIQEMTRMHSFRQRQSIG